MDRLSKLQALTGGGEGVVDQGESTENTWFTPTAKASNIYEGTDSEDDEIIMSRSRVHDQNIAGIITFENGKNRVDTTTAFSFELKQGQLAPEGVKFMTFKTATKYPYQFIGHGNKQKVAENFFDKNQVYGHTYDLFYLYADEPSFSQPIILIPSKQFESLLAAVNSKLKKNLTIPKGPAGDAFYIGFWTDGNAQPRYLGRSSAKEDFDALKARVPPYYHKLDGEPTTVEFPDKRSLAAFREKLTLMTANEKGKKAANKAKRNDDRIQRHQSWGGSIKRVQCYIGIREIRDDKEAISAYQRASSSQWVDMEAVAATIARETTEKYGPPTFFHPEKGMKFKPQDSVVFISIDVEAYEFNHKQITEIGVATLDTLDIVNVAPGEGGKNWMEQIRARHFRILEHRFLINKVHVSGCADSFEFGTSEFISIKDAPSVIASCFKHPFSGKEDTLVDDTLPKRNIVLVGHAVGGDVTFLKDIGYDIKNLSNLKDVVDTADMWKYLKKENNPAKLGIILHDLGLVGWNLHNAGNDAAYTMQVMIGLAIKHIVEKGKPRLPNAKGGLNSFGITASTSRGWESDSEDEGTSIAPKIDRNLIPAENEGIPSAASHDGDGNEVHNSKTSTSLDESAGVSPSNPASESQGAGDNSMPADDRQIVTRQEMLDRYINAPWGPEGDLEERIKSKFKLSPDQ